MLSLAPVGLQRVRIEPSRRGAVNDLAVESVTRAVTGTVPRLVPVVPIDSATHVSAARRQCVHGAVDVDVDSELVPIDINDSTVSEGQVLQRAADGLCDKQITRCAMSEFDRH